MYPFDVGEIIVVGRIVNNLPKKEIIAEVLGYYNHYENGIINSILYDYDGRKDWEYFTNCRKLTPLEKLI